MQDGVTPERRVVRSSLRREQSTFGFSTTTLEYFRLVSTEWGSYYEI